MPVAVFTNVRTVEDRRMLEEALVARGLDPALADLADKQAEPRTGRDLSGEGECHGVTYIKCGGGRLIRRKKIGGS